MDKEEVVMRLKEHLKANCGELDKITWGQKWYCLNYIMDFLFCDKNTACKILESEVLV